MSQFPNGSALEPDVLVLGEALINGVSDDRGVSYPEPPNPDGDDILEVRSFVTAQRLREDVRKELKAFSTESMRPQFQEIAELVRDELKLLRKDVAGLRASSNQHVVETQTIDVLKNELKSWLDEKQVSVMKNAQPESVKQKKMAPRLSFDSALPIMDKPRKDRREQDRGQLFTGRAFRGNVAMHAFKNFEVLEERTDKDKRRSTLKRSESMRSSKNPSEAQDREEPMVQRTKSMPALQTPRTTRNMAILPQNDRHDAAPRGADGTFQMVSSAPSVPFEVRRSFQSTWSGAASLSDLKRLASDSMFKVKKMSPAEAAPVKGFILRDSKPSDSGDRSQTTGKSRKTRAQVFLGKGLAHNEADDIESETDASSSVSRVRTACTNLVNSLLFDAISAFLITLNAVWIGVQTDVVARNPPSYVVPGYFKGIDFFFCIAFTMELVLRIYVYRLPFLYAKGWQWNIFDTILVVTQIAEELLARLAVSDASTPQYSFMRVLRILRLIRVIRLVRIVRMIGELRTLVTSIVSSLKSLSWTVVLLSGMMYVVGIYFTQLVSDHGRDDDVLISFFGSLGRSLLSLFEAFTGGIDWDTLADPLLLAIHPVCGVIFALYIAFAVLAVLNVVTGVFVESALAVTRHDKDIDLVNHLREVFAKTDQNNNGMLEWAEFERCVEDPSMDVVFKAVDLDRTEAQGLFELIDIDNKGEISLEEFIMGCLRLKGDAKALDLATLMYDNRRMANMLEEHMNLVEDYIHERAHRHAAAHAALADVVDMPPTSASHDSGQRASYDAVQRASSL